MNTIFFEKTAILVTSIQKKSTFKTQADSDAAERGTTCNVYCCCILECPRKQCTKKIGGSETDLFCVWPHLKNVVNLPHNFDRGTRLLGPGDGDEVPCHGAGDNLDLPVWRIRIGGKNALDGEENGLEGLQCAGIFVRIPVHPGPHLPHPVCVNATLDYPCQIAYKELVVT